MNMFSCEIIPCEMNMFHPFEFLAMEFFNQHSNDSIRMYDGYTYKPKRLTRRNGRFACDDYSKYGF
jgi:hypothetical protein